ncbi:MAG: response regulator [Phaeodactylibacter sp.]|nr:response regulator [Phaeodactylibacter sp.]MCB9051264.1 response regulator [Lewinellaceae bacterium]
MAAKILVVDDEPQFERLILQRFRRQAREGRYDFVFAQNGVEALDVLGRDRAIDMVLTDINMPKMDGLTLVGKIKKSHPRLRAVVVSAYGDMKNIRTAMNLGAFDFVTKPIEFSDLEATIEKTIQEAEVLKQAEAARELAEKNERLQELDQFKTDFFTDISHEFRTPLTVISGMTEQIEENPERWLTRGITMIRRNSLNLLNLVNQILDLRKLESGKMELRLAQGDVVPFLHYLFESFHSLAESRDIQMHFLGNVSKLVMDHDAEKLLRILSNLLANAIKFTPEGGHVYFQVDDVAGCLQVRIKDTGPGIPAGQLPFIFERFFSGLEDTPPALPEEKDEYRPLFGGSSAPPTAAPRSPARPPGQRAQGTPQSTGIGLSLAKELVTLMDGEIGVESREGKGTTFTIRIPIRQQAPLVEEGESIPSFLKAEKPAGPSPAFPSAPVPVSADVEAELTELPSLLIIEDNADVAEYLLGCLEGQYQLDIAQDGQQGIDKALEQVPDIIISDVMMPKKNGYEVCQTLKTDERTSHIPIILLTAKASQDSKEEGLSKGADAYLSKPFEKQELFIRLEKLLELRARLQEHYRSLEALPDTGTEGERQESQFVLKLRAIVEANMEDENFGIIELCREAGLSRPQLHRKVKALTGRSTSSFVRSIRLHRAKELLVNSDLNISQVAFEVGFRDPKYFSRTFQEEFGKSPNESRG